MSTTPIHDYPPYTKQPFISKQHGFTIVELLIVIGGRECGRCFKRIHG